MQGLQLPGAGHYTRADINIKGCNCHQHACFSILTACCFGRVQIELVQVLQVLGAGHCVRVTVQTELVQLQAAASGSQSASRVVAATSMHAFHTDDLLLLTGTD